MSRPHSNPHSTRPGTKADRGDGRRRAVTPSFRGDAKHRTRNPRIPRCAIAHLRSGANAPSRNDDHTLSSPAQAGDPVFQRQSVIEPRSRGVLDTPWVHDTSATPARVLWRWDNVMASSASKSELRSTACMQAVDLKTKLLLRSTGRRRRSVGNCGATPGQPRSGRGATSLSGPSNWPNADAGGMAASSWRASRTCGTAWAIALRWDIPPSRSLADWRWNMVASSSATSQSIVSSIIVQLRRIAGIVCCRAANEDEGTVQDATPPASSNNGARSPNAPPRSKAAGRRAIGKPTSCCSPDAARDCWFSTNDKPASASFSTRSIEKPSSPPGPSPVNSVNFHRRYAKPSASTTETSSPSITGFTKPSASKPSSAIPIVPGKKAAWKTPSGAYDARCLAKLTSISSRQPLSSGTFSASTIPHANAWTSRHPPRHSPNSNQSLHFKRDSIPRFRGV